MIDIGHMANTTSHSPQEWLEFLNSLPGDAKVEFDEWCGEQVGGMDITDISQLKKFVHTNIKDRRLVINGVYDHKKSGVTYDKQSNTVHVELF